VLVHPLQPSDFGLVQTKRTHKLNKHDVHVHFAFCRKFKVAIANLISM